MSKSTAELVRQVEGVAWEKAKVDAVQFLKTFVKTLDEHDEENPIKRIPVHPAIERMTQKWMSTPAGCGLSVAKSRQLMATWWALSLVLWEMMRLPGRLVGVVSKKENDAIKLIGETRLGTIYRNLPIWLKERYVLEPTKTQLTLRHGPNDPPCVCMAMPQGADQARMHTFSMLVFDEAAFQDNLEEAIVGAKPTLHGGGKILLISSAAPGTFEDIWKGEWGQK
jgi:hypothetical protein